MNLKNKEKADVPLTHLFPPISPREQSEDKREALVFTSGLDQVDNSSLQVSQNDADDSDNDQQDVLNISQNCLNYDFMIFLLDMTCCFLILVGMLGLLILACTVGIPYIPIISALSAQQVSGCILSAMLSVTAGGIGLALSCFFKPSIETSIPSQGSDQEVKLWCFF